MENENVRISFSKEIVNRLKDAFKLVMTLNNLRVFKILGSVKDNISNFKEK
jgi:hypothetical protein